MLRFENLSFFRATDGAAEKIPSSSLKRAKCAVTLAVFRSVAITSFSFPFNNVLRIREALKLQTLPYAAAGEMGLFPALVGKTPRSGSGVALYIPSEELKNFPAPPTPHADSRVWPAPLPLASKIGGEGVTLWLDEENICSMLWRGGVPVLYRWRPRASSSPETELSWYGLYCKSKGEEIGAVFAMDAAEPSQLAAFSEIARESLALCPWIGDVDISSGALDSALVLERTVRSLSKAASWILIMGLVALAGNGLRYYEARRNLDALRSRTTEFYRSVFEPSNTAPIADPLGLARSTVMQLKGGFSEGRSISEMFSDLGAIFEQNPGMNVTLDVTRYNAEGVDYTGSAPDMETLQEFRGAWAEKASSSQLGSLTAVPGGSAYRFNLSVRW